VPKGITIRSSQSHAKLVMKTVKNAPTQRHQPFVCAASMDSNSNLISLANASHPTNTLTYNVTHHVAMEF